MRKTTIKILAIGILFSSSLNALTVAEITVSYVYKIVGELVFYKMVDRANVKAGGSPSDYQGENQKISKMMHYQILKEPAQQSVSKKSAITTMELEEIGVMQANRVSTAIIKNKQLLLDVGVESYKISQEDAEEMSNSGGQDAAKRRDRYGKEILGNQ